MSELTSAAAAGDESLLQIQQWDAAYRAHIAATIRDRVTNHGALERHVAFREVCAVTSRSMSTIKAWLAYESAFPDLGSLARIIAHWKIPSEDLIPARLLAALPSVDAEPAGDAPLFRDLEAFNLFPTRHSSGSLTTQALGYYTAHPEECVWVRQPESDNTVIRQGELVLIDPAIESLADNAFYLLKIGHPGDTNTKMCIRFLRRLIGEPAVRLSRSDESADNSAEVLPLVNGSLPAHITLVGKVCGHVSKTP